MATLIGHPARQHKPSRDQERASWPQSSGLWSASWVGTLDMVANVWQWTNSRHKPYPYDKDDGRETNSDTDRFRVLRGGSYNNNEYELRSASRVDGAPDYYYVIGFRCARAFDNRP